ncbi:hypothetical protein OTU49_001797 [Cherax quadricarinatus]|uniref:Hyaluronidase n=1 Tax=Cherax quadricarinatus TaxID=27406 RepID=A0AAW0Y8E3_CHEQU
MKIMATRSLGCPGTWVSVGVLLWVVAMSRPCFARFTVYWNSPTGNCAKFGVHIDASAFGIVQNTDDVFYGDKVTIFYNPGAFPYLNNSTAVNGGIPQNGNLTHHLQVFTDKVHQQMQVNFSGVAVLDFETYYPSLDMSLPEYRQASREWVVDHYPELPPTEVDELAEATFNATARDFFEVLLWQGRQLRPGALWGYYHYPYCHNYNPGTANCKSTVMEHNNEMLWLIQMSSALYPSIYIFKDSGWDPATRRLNAQGRLGEAIRMRERAGVNIPILPYFWYRYHDSESYLSPLDVVNTLGYTKVLGLEGAVVWGSREDVATKEQCLSLKEYVEGQLGPLVQYLENLPQVTLRYVINSKKLLKRVAKKALKAAKRRSSSVTKL